MRGRISRLDERARPIHTEHTRRVIAVVIPDTIRGGLDDFHVCVGRGDAM